MLENCYWPGCPTLISRLHSQYVRPILRDAPKRVLNGSSCASKVPEPVTAAARLSAPFAASRVVRLTSRAGDSRRELEPGFPMSVGSCDRHRFSRRHCAVAGCEGVILDISAVRRGSIFSDLLSVLETMNIAIWQVRHHKLTVWGAEEYPHQAGGDLCSPKAPRF